MTQTVEDSRVRAGVRFKKEDAINNLPNEQIKLMKSV